MILYQESPQAVRETSWEGTQGLSKMNLQCWCTQLSPHLLGWYTCLRVSVGISEYNWKHPPWLPALFLHRYAFLTQGNLKNNILWYVYGQYVIDKTNFANCVSITFSIMSPLFEKCIVKLLLKWKEEKLIKISVTQNTLTQSTLKG